MSMISDRSSRTGRLGAVVLPAFTAVLVVAILVSDRNFWLDEAMAFAAVRDQGLVAPGQPLAEFEQAMPYGVYLVEKLLSATVGFHENLLRIPGLLAYLGGLFALWRASAVIESRLGRFAAMAAGGFGMQIVFQAAMFKQYIYEYCVGAVLLALGVLLLRSRLATRSVLVFFVVSVVALLFSNSAALATGSVALAVLVITFRTDRDSLVRARWVLVAAGVAYAVIFAALYLLVIRPAAVFQLSLPIYGAVGLLSVPNALAEIYAPTGKPLFLVFGFAIAVVVVLGIVLGLRRGWVQSYPFLVAVLMTLTATAATVTGLAPFFQPRHVLFTAPAVGLAFGLAVHVLWARLAPFLDRARLLRVVALALVAVIGLGFAGIAAYGAVRKQEEVGRALQAGDPACDQTYVEYSFQPAADLYVSRDRLGITLAGEVPTRSGMGHDSWFQRIRDHIPAYQATAVDYFRQHPGSCLLTAPRPGIDPLLVAVQGAGYPCTPVSLKQNIGLYRCGS